MKATKKIVGAACALVAAVALSAGSTFAWFSMNQSVTATGMSVTAKAPTSILISNTSDMSGFGSTVVCENDTTNKADTILPVAYSGLCDKWYTLTPVAMAKVNESGEVAGFTEVEDESAEASFTTAKIGTDDAYTNVVDSVAGTTPAIYVYHEVVWLKVEGEKDQDVTATVAYNSDTTTSDEIKNAMHVVFKVDGVTYNSDKKLPNIDMGGTKTTDKLVTLTANADKGTKVDIYYYLSGNDSNCKNSSISKNDLLSIDITFNATDVVVE